MAENKKKEILKEIKEQLRTAQPCKIGQEEKYFTWLGDNLLNKCQKLLPYCQQSSEMIMLNDLKERLEKIKNNELPDYNQTLAYSICQELGIQHGQEILRPVH